jgi:hypothetical protein
VAALIKNSILAFQGFHLEKFREGFYMGSFMAGELPDRNG